jgi:hypothetical protein
MEKETVIFNGHSYHRFPQSPHQHLQRYYWPGRTDRTTLRLGPLHQEVWKAHHGSEIPEGCLIHHRDENPLNNAPDNLECLTRKQHGERHPQGQPDWLMAHLDKIRDRATEWHQSAEGREWHKEHGKRTWESRQPRPRVCAYCHRTFQTLSGRDNVRYCSIDCRRRWQRARGIDRVERVCEICGTSYQTSRFKPARTCGKKCGAALRLKEGTHYKGGSSGRRR